MPAYATLQPPPQGSKTTGQKLFDVWHAVQGLLSQAAPQINNAYTQVVPNGTVPPTTDSPNGVKPSWVSTAVMIVVGAIGVMFALWLLRTLMPLLFSGGVILLIVVALLACYHNAQSQNRSRAYDSRPVYDSYAV
eukprot:Protomagalhaensia_sp_Gyna_25__5704@NODE_814_length_2561_cov_95_628073_g641_i0_p3_GENE_NODE_814_length_2561_cov_95_628073_g641_i0NODE_814_length_2561_cov_95_628073_g641_i0_p3_ORF_typecomplete_len135_score4_46Keratin_assoc/PF09775_9/0_015DUF4131/PF13567_6/0_019Tetraspanin/PF00335_20/0_026DUF2244/PF10003_9/0_027DUF2207/PF09972_9/0_031LST1/PF05083_13/1_1e04LST1/PF05083_13/0_084DUF1129/PF06570_11/0_098Wzy_C/PF04932_15/0_12Alpha_GJ/PF03229_13/0_49Alpha_GJ/PF03229_13/7_6e02DUF1700/PF08006_11/0_14DUF538